MTEVQVEIVVPVCNEEGDLGADIRRLMGYLRKGFPFTARVTIADNGSTDGTWAIAVGLEREMAEVRAVHMEQPGRGRALRAIWAPIGRKSVERHHLHPAARHRGPRHVRWRPGPAPAARAPDGGVGGPRGGTGGRGFPGGTTVPGAPGGTGAPGGGTRPGGTAAGTGNLPGRTGGFGGTGGPGGLSGDTQVSSALAKLLEQNAGRYEWVAATEGSQEAAPLELATGDAVIAIGGFNGTDPWPTLAAFKQLVASHEVHYYLGRNNQSFGGGQGSSAIASWVAANFKKETVGGQTVYDLTQPISSAAS